MLFDTADLPNALIYKLLSATITPRPIAWISTRGTDGTANLAPFSFFNVMGDQPPILAVGINPGPQGRMKDSARNIVETGAFVVNLVPETLAEAMNASAIDAPPGVSEFDLAGVTEAPATHVAAPLVAQSPVSFECVTHSSLLTGPNQLLVVGRVLAIHIEDRFVLDAARAHIDGPALALLGRGHATTYIRTGDTFEMRRPKWDAAQSSTKTGA